MKNIVLALRFGLVTSSSLIAFFLILSLFNAHIYPVYSIFNSVIIGFGIYESIKAYQLRQGEKFNYSNGFSTGIITGFAATIILVIFFTFYITEININFPINLVEVIKDNDFFTGSSALNLDINGTAMMVSSISNGMKIMVCCLELFIIIILGFTTTIILTLLCMRLISRKRL
jgi:hypothetical protein